MIGFCNIFFKKGTQSQPLHRIDAHDPRFCNTRTCFYRIVLDKYFFHGCSLQINHKLVSGVTHSNHSTCIMTRDVVWSPTPSNYSIDLISTPPNNSIATCSRPLSLIVSIKSNLPLYRQPKETALYIWCRRRILRCTTTKWVVNIVRMHVERRGKKRKWDMRPDKIIDTVRSNEEREKNDRDN